MTRYEKAVSEVQSVLSECHVTIDSRWIATRVVERLVAKGVIQSTDPEELQQYRTGPLEPGRTVIGGDDLLDHHAQPGSVQRSEDESDA